MEIQYRVNKKTPYNVFYRLDNPIAQLHSYIQDTIRAKVPTMDLDHVYTDLIEIKETVKQRLTIVLEQFGYELLTALIVDLTPHHAVAESMNNIQVEKRMRVAAYARAEAQKIMIVKEGEAKAEEKRLNGEAVARMRKAIVDGLHGSLESLSEQHALTHEQAMDMVLMTQFFDYLTEVGGNSTRMQNSGMDSHGEVNFIYHNPAALAGIRDTMRAMLEGDMNPEKGKSRLSQTGIAPSKT